MLNKDFFVKNRERMLEQLPDESLVILFAGRAPHMSADNYYDFVPNKNFYYMTGTAREEVILLALKAEGKVEETLFIEQPDSLRETWTGKMLHAEDAQGLSGIDTIKYIAEFDSSLTRTLTRNENLTLYLDLEQRQWNDAQDIVHSFAAEMKQKFPHMTIKNIHNLISELRTIKTEEEVNNLRTAINITGEGIRNMMRNSSAGIMEYQLQAHFEFSLKHAGVRPAFNSIIAAGANATVLHYSSNNCKAENDSLVLCDVGGEYGYYSADITRTFPVSGKFTERQKEVYNIVLEANLATIKAMKPGVSSKSLNDIAAKVLAEGCKRIGLITDDSELKQYYFHGVSHQLGLDTHDVGKLGVDLKPGMVFTVEPGLYIREEGIGIRIEDDVLITKDGCEVLSQDVIKTVAEIEAFMKC